MDPNFYFGEKANSVLVPLAVNECMIARFMASYLSVMARRLVMKISTKECYSLFYIYIYTSQLFMTDLDCTIIGNLGRF